MQSGLRFLVVAACLFAPSLPTLAQSDPFQALLTRYGAARTPLDAEGIIVPGSLLIQPDSRTGTIAHVLPYEISKEDAAYSDAALQDMEVVPLESING